MLKVENVSKLYRSGAFGGKKKRVIHDVDFEVKPGEVVSLIGESGSGKTTVGRMILRLTSVSEGRITFDGEDISKLKGPSLKAYYRRVQGVFQDPFSSFNPIFKVGRVFRTLRREFLADLDDAAFAARLTGALNAVGLEVAALDKYPHQMSGGQLQRLLIARALLLDIRREHPNASAALILRTLVADGRLTKGAVSVVTLRRLYREHRLDRATLLRKDRGKTRLRWEAARPNALWHGDVCHAAPSVRCAGSVGDQ